MKKTLIALCLSLLLLFALCACGENEPDTTSSQSQQTSESAENNSDGSTETADESKKEESTKESAEESEKTESTEPVKKEYEAFPSFSTEDIFGKKVTSDVFSENELTVVNVFATWCEPCKRELPELAKLDGELDDVGFVGIVLDINEGDGIDENALKTAKQLCNDAEAEYPYLITDEALNAFCGEIYTVPVTYFVNRDGEIVGDPIFGANDAETWIEFINNHRG